MFTQKDIEDECREFYLLSGRWEPTTKDLMAFFSKKIATIQNESIRLNEEIEELKKTEDNK